MAATVAPGKEEPAGVDATLCITKERSLSEAIVAKFQVWEAPLGPVTAEVLMCSVNDWPTSAALFPWFRVCAAAAADNSVNDKANV